MAASTGRRGRRRGAARCARARAAAPVGPQLLAGGRLPPGGAAGGRRSADVPCGRGRGRRPAPARPRSGAPRRRRVAGRARRGCRLTRRARRLAVVLALALGVAIGSWLGPLLAGGGGDLRLPGCRAWWCSPGDTLWSIAVGGGRDRRRPRRSSTEIQELNGLHGHRADARPGPRAAVTTGRMPSRARPTARGAAATRCRDARHGKRPTTSRRDFVNPQCGRVHRLWSLRPLTVVRCQAPWRTEQRCSPVSPRRSRSIRPEPGGPGELLGWRHDADGSCQVWVRVVLGGVEETAWTDLATLRLPERHLSVARPRGAPRPGDPGDVRGPRTRPAGVPGRPTRIGHRQPAEGP